MSGILEALEAARLAYGQTIGIFSSNLDDTALVQTAQNHPEIYFFAVTGHVGRPDLSSPKNLSLWESDGARLHPLNGHNLVDQIYVVRSPQEDTFDLETLLPLLAHEPNGQLLGGLTVFTRSNAQNVDFADSLRSQAALAVYPKKGLWPGQMPSFAYSALNDSGRSFETRIVPAGHLPARHSHVREVSDVLSLLARAICSGRKIHLEVGCGSSPDKLRGLARQNPATFYIGVDPEVSLDPLVKLEPNIVLCPTTSHELLNAVPGQTGWFDTIRILAPYGFSRDYIHEIDIEDYARVLKRGGEFSVFSELFVWMQDYYASVLRHFGNVELKLFAPPALLDHEEDLPRFRYKWSPGCLRYWNYTAEGSDAESGQWGMVSVGIHHKDWPGRERLIAAPLFPRDQAPPSLYDDYNGKSVIFQVRGIKQE